jgi:hypothetical protein
VEERTYEKDETTAEMVKFRTGHAQWLKFCLVTVCFELDRTVQPWDGFQKTAQNSIAAGYITPVAACMQLNPKNNS